ncbi:MAG: hypothetical protein O9306_13625 [Beijerinckiaceae bacterium]|jgi:hypothetical protein|nr:hypothetical protein [Beijerinckiaceae bacterium]
MRILSLLTLAVVSAITVAAPASAARLICEYSARLSSQDHFNSNGERLDSVAAIIRQDRYYFHVQGAGDAEDEDDCFFGSKSNRELLERMVSRGRIDAAARRAIVNGTPMIRVRIYRDNIGDYCVVAVF